jgi:ankyrin repeat protein
MINLLLRTGANVTAKTIEESTVLHLAAAFGNEAAVRLLIEKGANVKAKDKFRATALHLAAANGQDAAVRLLVEKGVDKVDHNDVREEIKFENQIFRVPPSASRHNSTNSSRI